MLDKKLIYRLVLFCLALVLAATVAAGGLAGVVTLANNSDPGIPPGNGCSWWVWPPCRPDPTAAIAHVAPPPPDECPDRPAPKCGPDPTLL